MNMGAFGESFPYTNFHDLNTDWIIKIVKDFKDKYPDVMAELVKKINKPVTTPDGRAGDILMSNGDGSTQWIDYGAIYNPQIHEAVFEWLDEHPEATTTVVDGSLTLQKFSEQLQKQTLNAYLTPDQFEGETDAEKVQNCYDYALANSFDGIVIDRIYNITGSTIMLTKPALNFPWGWRQFHFFNLGKGGFIKTDEGYMFSATTRSMSYAFHALKFLGCELDEDLEFEEEYTNVFRAGDKLIHIYLDNCEFRYLASVIDGDGAISTETCIQSIYTDRCIFYGCKNVMKWHVAWNVEVKNSNIQNCDTFIVVTRSANASAQTNHLVIFGNVIEYVTSSPLQIGESNYTDNDSGTTNLNISNNYNEYNKPYYLYGYFNGVVIENNRHTRNIVPTEYCYIFNPSGASTVIFTGNTTNNTDYLIDSTWQRFIYGVNRGISASRIKDLYETLDHIRYQDGNIGITDLQDYSFIPDGISVFTFTPTSTNRPAGYGLVRYNKSSSSGWCSALCISDDNKVYTCFRSSGSGWSAWKRILQDGDSTTPTTTNGNMASNYTGNVYYRKYGNVVNITGEISGLTTGNVTIATLPEGYRPADTVNGSAHLTGNEMRQMNITTSGNIILYGSITDGTATFNETFII